MQALHGVQEFRHQLRHFPAPAARQHRQQGALGGQPQFRIRGVGLTDYAANNTSTVGIYVDEVAYPYGVMTQGLLYDIARIEVLRGPQGTLYGRNTTGGAVSVSAGASTSTGSKAGGQVSLTGASNSIDSRTTRGASKLHDASKPLLR